MSDKNNNARGTAESQKNIYRQNYTRYINGILADYNPVL